jgi:hypothetical protein
MRRRKDSTPITGSLATSAIAALRAHRLLWPVSTNVRGLKRPPALRANHVGSSLGECGVLIALTNLASPTFLPSLIFVLSLLQVRGWVGHEVGDYVMYALGFGVGAALWYVLLLRTVSHFRAQFSPTVMPLLDSVAGGVLLLCAGLLTYSVVTTTAWSRLLGG